MFTWKTTVIIPEKSEGEWVAVYIFTFSSLAFKRLRDLNSFVKTLFPVRRYERRSMRSELLNLFFFF